MAIPQVGPALIRRLALKIGIEIAVRHLRPDHQINGFLRLFPQFTATAQRQLVSYRLQPLGQVAILEHHAIVLSLALPGRYAKVLNAMAFFYIGYFIIQCTPLEREHLCADVFLYLCQHTVFQAYMIPAR